MTDNTKAKALFLKAKAIFRQNVESAPKNGMGQYGPFSTKADILDAIQKANKIEETGLSHEQYVTEDNFHVTYLCFSDGENYYEDKDNSYKIRLPEAKTMQQVGSALTYAERYGLRGVYGIATEDDDGKGCEQSNIVYNKKQNNLPSKKTFSKEIYNALEKKVETSIRQNKSISEIHISMIDYLTKNNFHINDKSKNDIMGYINETFDKINQTTEELLDDEIPMDKK